MSYAQVMQTLSSPTVAAWELGIRLKGRREQLGLTASGTAQRAKCTQAYVSGVEAGRVKIPDHRLAKLIAIYDIDKDEAVELEDLRAVASQRAWWHEYAPLMSNDFQRFLGFEAAAEQLRTYQGELVPGLLQTAEYTRALISGGYPYTRLAELERRLKLRLTRQARLSDDPPLQITALLGEGVLLNQIGGAEVMRGQLLHLADAAEEKEHIEIRVLRFSAGAHPSVGNKFEILSFASPRLPDVVLHEGINTSATLDAPPVVNDFAVAFGTTAQMALSDRESIDFMRRIAEEMK